MRNTLKNGLKIATVLVASSIASMTFAENLPCPTLTANDIQAMIESPARTLDGYYYWETTKRFNNQKYIIMLGNLAGENIFEAQERAKKLLLTGEESFNGIVGIFNTCLYKEIRNPSKYISNYPASATAVMLVAWASKLESDEIIK